jgi:RecA-family ATPase
MPVTTDQPLAVVRVGEIRSEESAQRWLVEGLWGARSVGVIGGVPKCAKTWLGLDMALSVATGTACWGKYAVPEPGPVLVDLAEDALLVVRERVAGMARHRGLDLAQVAIHVITAPVLRLDRGPDRARLLETTQRLRPRLLLLDPLVRLHSIDENNAGEVAELLAYFRSLQRQLDLSVLLVHHTRKNAAGVSPPVRDCAAPVTSMPSATRTWISGEPRNTWCSPTSTAQRRHRRRSIWNWSQPTRRRPTWR